MNTKKIEQFLSDFVLSPKYRFHRNALLIITLLVISSNIILTQSPNTSPLLKICGFFMHGGLMLISTYFNIYFLIPRLLLKEKWFLYFLSIAILACITVGCIAFMQLFLLGFKESMPSFTNTMLFIAFSSSLMVFSMVNAGIATLILFRYWAVSSQRIQELESATLESELKYLKGQINPHFLFNMLNNVNVLLKERRGGASHILHKLEYLLKYQINESSKDKIALSSDIVFLNDFLNLEKIRRDHFDYSINIIGESDYIQLPPLIFIPFVENAVKYSQDSDNDSYVHITFIIDDKSITFYCENSKPEEGITKKKIGGLGLRNIQRRLELLFPNRYNLDITDEEILYTVNLQLTL